MANKPKTPGIKQQMRREPGRMRTSVAEQENRILDKVTLRAIDNSVRAAEKAIQAVDNLIQAAGRKAKVEEAKAKRITNYIVSLAGNARGGLIELVRAYPGVVITSAGRDREAQARIDAQYSAINPNYVASLHSGVLAHRLEHAVGVLGASATEGKLRVAFTNIMNKATDKELYQYSRHIFGQAFDASPKANNSGILDALYELRDQHIAGGGIGTVLTEKEADHAWHLQLDDLASTAFALGENSNARRSLSGSMVPDDDDVFSWRSNTSTLGSVAVRERKEGEAAAMRDKTIKTNLDAIHDIERVLGKKGKRAPNYLLPGQLDNYSLGRRPRIIKELRWSLAHHRAIDAEGKAEIDALEAKEAKAKAAKEAKAHAIKAANDANSKPSPSGSVPHLATGGLMLTDHPAYVHRDEIILPLDRATPVLAKAMEQSHRAGGGMTVNLHVHPGAIVVNGPADDSTQQKLEDSLVQVLASAFERSTMQLTSGF